MQSFDRATSLFLLGSLALVASACFVEQAPACHVAQVTSSGELSEDARAHFLEALRATGLFREVDIEGQLSRSPHLYVDLVSYPRPGDRPPGVEHGFGFRIRGPGSDEFVEIDTRERRGVFEALLVSLRGVLFEGRPLSSNELAEALSGRWPEIESLTACIRFR